MADSTQTCQFSRKNINQISNMYRLYESVYLILIPCFSIQLSKIHAFLAAFDDFLHDLKMHSSLNFGSSMKLLVILLVGE